jgi:putative tryptophan/tyrosine transport system permease protein
VIFFFQAIIYGICLGALGFGIFITMKIFKIPDITTDGSYTLGGVTSGVLLIQDWNWYFVLPLAFIVGSFAGSITGLVHTKLKVDALLAGILVMTAMYSINLTILGRSNLPLNDIQGLFNIAPSINWIPVLILIFLLGIGIHLLLKTDFGLAMRATGESESMTESLGINNDRMKIIGLSIANGLTAISGFIMVQYQGFADINMGIGVVLVGLGSVLIGETLFKFFSLKGLAFRLIFVLVGSIAFQVLLASALTIGVNPNFIKLITAMLVLSVVGMPKLLKKS